MQHLKSSAHYYISYTRESRQYAYSFDVQDRKIEEHSQRNGNVIKYKFTERRSAFKNKTRPEFEKAIQTLKGPNCKGIYFAKVDRSLRNLRDMIQLEQFIGTKEIIFINGEFNLDTAQGRKAFRDSCVNACHYSEDLSEKIIDSQKEMLEDGKYPYGMPMYLIRTNGVLKRNNHTTIAERVFEMYSTGIYTDMSLAKRLNTLGYTQPNGKKFTKKSITQILTNPLFAGFYKNAQGQEFALKTKAVITRSFWEQIHNIRKNRNRRGGAKHNYTYSKLISYAPNKYLCGEIVKNNVYYKAVRSPDFYFIRPEKEKKVRQVKEEHIDKTVCNHLKELSIDKVLFENLEKTYQIWLAEANSIQEERKSDINQQLNAIHEKMVQAPLDHMEGKFSAEILKKIMERLQSEEKDLQKKLNNQAALDKEFFETTQRLLKLIQVAHSNFERMTSEVKRPLFELFLTNPKVISGELFFENTPYLQRLIEISEKEVFEPTQSQSQSSDSGFVCLRMKTGGEKGMLFEQLHTIDQLYKKYQVKEKIRTIWSLLKRWKNDQP